MKNENTNKKRISEVEKLKESFVFVQNVNKKEAIDLQNNVIDLSNEDADDKTNVIPTKFTMESLRHMIDPATVAGKLKTLPQKLKRNPAQFKNPVTNKSDGNRRMKIPQNCWFHFPQHVNQHLIKQYLAKSHFLSMQDLKITTDTTAIH